MRKDPVKMTKNNSFTDCVIDLPRDGISDDCEFDRDESSLLCVTSSEFKIVDILLRLFFILVESARHGRRRRMIKLRMAVKATGAKNPVASSQ